MITLYSTHCPRCYVLRAKLDAKNIEYTEENDIDKMLEMGIQSVPVLGIDAKLLSFKDANNWINNQ